MIVTIKKPDLKYTAWSDIKPGTIFSWGTQSDWFVKTGPLSWTGLGASYSVPVSADVPKCSTLVVASKVEITP